MTERPAWSATDKQRNWLKDLAVAREMPERESQATLILIERDDFLKADATKFIDKFLGYPKVAKTVTSTVGAAGVVKRVSPLEDLPNTRFAIPVTELSHDAAAFAGNSDMLFGELKTYKDWRYMNALKGAPGDFSRARVKGAVQKEIADLLRENLLGYVRNYGTYYSCCSCCGAALTDDVSRRLQLGPECRKRFGL